MGYRAVGQTLGPDARITPGGYTLEKVNGWPTVLNVLHVDVPEEGRALWKLSFVGHVTHLITFQQLAVDVVYEGPLGEELLAGLRAEPSDKDNELQARFIDFVKSRVEVSLPAPWQDAAALKNDRYRARFLAVYDGGLADLRGKGQLRHERFVADITLPDKYLRLSYQGEGHYRVELHATMDLGPVPVL